MDSALALTFGGGERQTRLVINPRVRQLCPRPYPGHPKGCPNFNNRESCPPRARLINKVLDLSKPLWVIWNVFPLDVHVAKMRRKHPEWSERQLRCCLYWQGTARKQLKDRVRRFLIEQGATAVNYTILYCPEAHGVDVTKTAAKHGLELQWPPEDYACQVAIAGIRKTTVARKRQGCCANA